MITELTKKATARESALKKVSGTAVPVGELVKRLCEEDFTRDEAVGALVTLESERRVSVMEGAPYASLASYALSPFSLWFWATLAAVAASLALVSATSGAALDLRYLFGGALVLFIPGFSFVEALYPKPELDGLTRLALSIGLSLALVPLVALVLNYSPFGIRLLPVAVSIAGFAVVFLVASLVRKHAYYRLARGVA